MDGCCDRDMRPGVGEWIYKNGDYNLRLVLGQGFENMVPTI
jgi:hypothetical protein